MISHLAVVRWIDSKWTCNIWWHRRLSFQILSYSSKSWLCWTTEEFLFWFLYTQQSLRDAPADLTTQGLQVNLIFFIIYARWLFSILCANQSTFLVSSNPRRNILSIAINFYTSTSYPWIEEQKHGLVRGIALFYASHKINQFDEIFASLFIIYFSIWIRNDDNGDLITYIIYHVLVQFI